MTPEKKIKEKKTKEKKIKEMMSKETKIKKTMGLKKKKADKEPEKEKPDPSDTHFFNMNPAINTTICKYDMTYQQIKT